ncbi:MAG TPA: hypothetical protein VFG93_04010 [Gaiellaceae bacterium]|nr:hypothetical protein [Gaiellaceae bacterium]
MQKERERSRGLPPPAPPQSRTAAQVVAESMRLYGRRFWKCVALGFGPVLVAIGITALPSPSNLVFAATAGATIVSACYVAACVLASEVRLTRRSAATALLVGTLVFVPVPFLTRILIFPGVVWLALFGLAVPAVLYEQRGFGESLGRAVTLARADFVHALGSLAALGIVGFVSALAMASLLVQFGDQARSVAALLPLFFVTPLLFLGAAQLYFDQFARLPENAPRAGLTAPQRRGQPSTRG